ncbi:hypothetical protein PVAND_016745 [Polypedilum vanderplanki]|uniref:Luciferin 4-monooxygenase n=1 Tax=Polypedilum vanderplanki TaxID=319348 RepID=A0A9J6BH84_POLVA|nr:hypothetical protein PVAND_016745 [Polypedilum vanderplanki]
MVDNDPNVIYGGDFEEKLQFASLGELLIQHFTDGGEKPALINGATGETWSFREILTPSSKLARVLYGAGIRQNDVVSILAENRFEFTAISYGTILLNAILAPVNTTYTERELKHSLDISRPKFMFVSKVCENKISLLKKLSYIKRIILLDNNDTDENTKIIPYKKFINKFETTSFDVEKYASQKVNLSEQVALIFMSSGTTGLPKGCLLTHLNIFTCVAINLERVPLGKELFGNVVSLSIAPWFHSMGFMAILLSATTREFSMVYLDKFEPELYLQCIEKYKVVTIQVAPPLVVFLAKTPLLNKYDLSSLKVIFSGAAPLTQETEDQVKERFNNEIIVLQGYGQTEATLGVLYGSVSAGKPGSVGELAKGVYAKIVDEKGKSLGPNKVGELCVKGPLVMKGYLNNNAATKETIDKNSWLHTGDLGYYDEDFQFFIVDRLKELIKYKAFQVPPAELEALLLKNPKIKDVGVIGIPDEVAGELPFAFVVKQPGVELTEEEVKDFVVKNASDAKWLRGGVKFIDEIPKNPSGKILRRDLRDLYKNTKSKL